MKALLLFLFLPLTAMAQNTLNDNEINKKIKEFFKSPATFYNLPVLKKSSFLTKKVSSEEKRSLREKIFFHQADNTKSLPLRNDSVYDLYPNDNIEANIFKLKASAKLSVQPWSDDYWPIYKGILGARYNTNEFTNLYNWEDARNYVMENALGPEMTTNFIDNLSPSEKFDLLISNESHLPLTQSMWSQGKSYFDNNGEVEKWMGICHGWAPASFRVERPKNAITVKSANGKYDIKFYPSDVKALVSLLWASGHYQTNFVGGRCNSKDPSRNDEDRLSQKECLDTNPATFHLALTNGIGEMDQSFVMDATFDYEVWNQPIVSYKYKFFNVLDKKVVPTIKESLVDIKKYSDDPFKKYRGKRSKYIMGVHLQVTYGVETSPTHNTDDSEIYDQLNTAYYYYDLELDENHNVIGGEWFNSQHPDFLWRPAGNSRALTNYDYYLMSESQWDGEFALDQYVQDLAIKAASEGRPLAFIVNSLVNLSQKSGERE